MQWAMTDQLRPGSALQFDIKLHPGDRGRDVLTQQHRVKNCSRVKWQKFQRARTVHPQRQTVNPLLVLFL